MFSLYNGLNKSLIYYLSCGSLNVLSSYSLLVNWRSIYSGLNGGSIRSSTKSNSFGVINHRSEVNWLSYDFSSRSLDSSKFSSWSSLKRLSNWSISHSSGWTSIYIYYLFSSMNSRLHKLFSNGDLSRHWHINRLNSSSLIDNRFIGNSLCIYRSSNNFSPNNRGLNNSLSNDRLRNQFLSNNGLWYHLSSNNRFGNQLLSLSNHWFWIQYLRGNPL